MKKLARYICFAMMLAFVLLTILACAGCTTVTKKTTHTGADGKAVIEEVTTRTPSKGIITALIDGVMVFLTGSLKDNQSH